ncbi:hypothetical protein TNCT_624511 [Trichonephila clavata]|uniref:Uncharacterized protein n=1 Tax=Trichonephila clavata TaxID=2740835 RepID=A0A8X6H4X5_TRICU|nr:hypothetical protein TNCT_624511 [Trichonephila clavata]
MPTLPFHRYLQFFRNEWTMWSELLNRAEKDDRKTLSNKETSNVLSDSSSIDKMLPRTRYEHFMHRRHRTMLIQHSTPLE